MDYNFSKVEKKWQKYWAENKTFKAENTSSKPKFYVLDMFPYPSGAGLHVGHPLGYIASDIYSRYKRLKGYNVLHPMGYDSFGLPAEQFAIQTGTHPATTTEKNIARYREQLDKMGFSYDWDREVRTSNPYYYKWTQWTFIQLFNSWYNNDVDKAENIEKLIGMFETSGTTNVNAACSESNSFSANQWKSKSELEKQEILLNYRLAYLSDSLVNWCPALGTVLANDEVSNGLSVRGGFAVEKKSMLQWSLRVTAYADRLLKGMEKVDWPESIKEIQKNWIGKSQGASITFNVKDSNHKIEVFTTRADTIFGSTYMVLAPEHELVDKIVTEENKDIVSEYVVWARNRSERERMTEVKKITGQFTGAYAINPLSEQEMPIWIADYVLAGYGTGAIMAVPAHDTRDYAFAKYFNLPIVEVVSGGNIEENAFDAKEGIMINSGFLNGLTVQEAINAMTQRIEELEIGYGKINYRLHDAIFSRQRYWGEPIPVYYKNGMPYVFDISELPLELPEVDAYLPTESGEPPLARAKNWTTKEGYPLEINTMPGFAGSCGYYLRYMDPKNEKEYFSKKANQYWGNVDLYIGGAEHATGHLLYARFWNKFLFDIGYVCKDEPFKKLINQGMILGRSSIVYRIYGTNTFVSFGLKDSYEVQPVHVDVNIVQNDVLDIEAFRSWQSDLADAEFILENGKYICGWEIEKMSKSLLNVQNPDSIIEKYGADTLRMYEMFLGPLEQSKPWDTNGIEGVFRFIRKLWNLFHDKDSNFVLSECEPSLDELKILHKTIKKIEEDIERYSYNTSISTFMICVNELVDLKCNKKAILEPLVILISSFAPHIAEELWQLMGNQNSITYADFPVLNQEYLIESTVIYPVSFNGKTRFNIEIPIGMSSSEIENQVLAHPDSQKWLDGKAAKKVIIVQGRIVNIVI